MKYWNIVVCGRGLDPVDLPIRELQKKLVKNGVILHIADAQ